MTLLLILKYKFFSKKQPDRTQAAEPLGGEKIYPLNLSSSRLNLGHTCVGRHRVLGYI